MKNILFILLAITFIVTSCKKKGCKDETAINYNGNTKVDNDPTLCEYSTVYTGTKEIISGHIQSHTVWPNLTDIDYTVNHVISLFDTLIIEPGVTVLFGTNGGFKIRSGGHLIIEGTETENVILKNKVEGGFWSGVNDQSSSNSTLKLVNVLMQNAGGMNSASYGISLNDGMQIIFNNLSLDGGGSSRGLVISGLEIFPQINSVTIKNYDRPFVSSDLGAISQLNDFTLQDNNNNWFELTNYSYGNYGAFNNLPHPVYFSSSSGAIFSQFSATGECEFVFRPTETMTVTGSFSCTGTESSPVIFRSSISGYFWRGIRVNLSYNPSFSYTDILDIGGSNYYEAVEVAYNSSLVGDLTFTNCYVEATNIFCGVTFEGSGFLTSSDYDFTGSTFTGCNQDYCP